MAIELIETATQLSTLTEIINGTNLQSAATKVGALMTFPVFAVMGHHRLNAVRHLLRPTLQHFFLVFDDRSERPIGIITERHLAGREHLKMDCPVSEFMDADLPHVNPLTPITEALNLMATYRLPVLPVYKDEKFVGILEWETVQKKVVKLGSLT